MKLRREKKDAANIEQIKFTFKISLHSIELRELLIFFQFFR